MRILSIVFFLMALHLHAFANEDSGLYYTPSENASFVRIINISQKNQANITINKSLLPVLKPFSVTPYYSIENDKEIILKTDGQSINEFKLDTTNTIVADDDVFIILRDIAQKDITRSQIYFYNFKPDTLLSLKTSDGKITIIDNIRYQESGQRSVNPISLKAAIFDENNKFIAEFPSLTLENRQSYSFFLFPDGQIKIVLAVIEPLP